MESMKPVLTSLDSIIANLEAALHPKPEPSPDGSLSTTTANSAEQAAAPKQKKKKEKKAKAAATPAVDPVVSQFLQCDLRVGRVSEVATHPEADALYVLKVVYGEDETRTVCAGMRGYLTEEEMRGLFVVTICNLKPRKLRGVVSEAMALAGSVVGEGGKEKVVPIVPAEGSRVGEIVGVEGIVGERSVVEGKFVSGKVWDKVVGRFEVRDGVACYDGKALGTGSGKVGCDLPDGSEIH